jgi:hypothetical protein
VVTPVTDVRPLVMGVVVKPVTDVYLVTGVVVTPVTDVYLVTGVVVTPVTDVYLLMSDTEFSRLQHTY